MLAFYIIVGSLVATAFVFIFAAWLNGDLAPSKEKTFLKENCPAGGKHIIQYKSLTYAYQEMYCTKCGKSITTNK
jgi:hypothetical protein